MISQSNAASSMTTERSWRCYSRGTLDEMEMVYVSGKAYCTRHFELQRELQSCLQKRQQQEAAATTAPGVRSDDAGEVRAAVDPFGGSRRMAPLPTPPAMPTLSEGLAAATVASRERDDTNGGAASSSAAAANGYPGRVGS
eukprot:CAMPEP_0115888360 /NCGR_PEP_ID=MMETSP0287-20121206/32264_1 /TAXON_ID=412157 /ORGANISM="Chrysochromulina rotalis, Strain UIO044" /LENGTH=140 /DNA_ID=CAMNT_0003345035 /DNA_START=61 /DNA_END=480 /DNA_ORIENTATION=+